MSVLFSRQCEYAIQATLYIALQSDKRLVSIRELADRLAIPPYFLAKILQDLTRKGILKSQKGPSGGFTLDRASGDLRLINIIDAIDGNDLSTRCVLGIGACDEEKPCSLHEKWSASRDAILTLLQEKSISELAQEMEKPEYVTH